MVYCAETRLSYLSRDTPGILCHYLPLRPVHTQRFFVAGSAHPYTLELMGPLGYTIFTTIAKYGYTDINRTAFFPLYSLLERALMYVHNNPLIDGLIISNLAGLGIFVVLYRLVSEDFNAGQAERTVLYLALFPTAFYLASGYNESLFIFLVVLNFYQLRHGHWWWAGLFGFLAGLTRSAGILLL